MSALFVYPVKGMAAVPAPRLELDDVGPVGDRRWMVVGKEGDRFLTQRSHPGMALLEALTLDGGEGVVLRAEGHEPLEVRDPPGEAPRMPVAIWNDRVEAALAAEEAHGWLSEVLEEPVRLVRLPDDVVRPVDPGRTREGYRKRVAFADAFPILVLSEASVADIDGRMPEDGSRIGVNRFRPNVVVGGTAAWEEDTWRSVRIGDVDLALVKPCPRCAVTTVDPATGEKGHEPLRTLALFREAGGKVWVGQNALHAGPGTLTVGEPVEVLQTGPPRPGAGLQKQWA